MLDEARITEQRAALCDAAGQAFYNTSKFTLRDLKSRGSQQQLLADFEDYLERLLAQRPGHPRQLQVPQPAPDALEGRRPRHADQQVPRPRHRPLAGRHRQPLDGHGLRGAGPQVQRGEQRGGGRALDAARRRAADGEPRLPADRGRDQVRHLPALRLRLRHGRHAHRRRGDAHGHRRQARPAGQVPALRPGDQPRDLRRLQGRHAAEGRRRERRPHRRRRGMVHALARRLPGARVRLHARQPALRQELEEGPRGDGRQGRHARPALQGDARGRGALARHPLQRRPDALPRQHGLEDERQVGARQPHRRGAQRLVALHRRRRPGREQHPPLADRERLARSHRRAAAQPLLQHRHRHLHLGAVQQEARAPQGPGAAHRRQPVVQAAAQEPRQEELRALARGHRAHQPHLPRLQGDAGVEDLPQRRLRLLEGHGRAPAAPAQPAHAQGHRDAALHLGRRGHSRGALRGVRRRPLHRASPRSPPRWRSAWPTGAATRTRATTKRAAARRRACPRRRARSCSTPRPGSATAAWSRSPRSCARRWATRSSRTTTSSATAWTTRSRRPASSSPPPT